MRFCTIWHSHICYSHCWGHRSTLWTFPSLKILISGSLSSSPILFLSLLFGGLPIHLSDPLNSWPSQVIDYLAFKDYFLNPISVTLDLKFVITSTHITFKINQCYAIGTWLRKTVWARIAGRKLELKGHRTYTSGEEAQRTYLKQVQRCCQRHKGKKCLWWLRVHGTD